MEDTGLFKTLVDVFPAPLFVVDEDVRILVYNPAAAPFLGDDPDRWLHFRLGEVINCRNHVHAPGGCGTSDDCGGCVVRNSVNGAFEGERVTRTQTRLWLQAPNGDAQSLLLLVTCAPFVHSGKNMVLLILEDVGEITELRRLVPICSYCKKVRNDKEYWDRVEDYLERRLGAEVTHGICPECAAKLRKDWTL